MSDWPLTLAALAYPAASYCAVQILSEGINGDRLDRGETVPLWNRLLIAGSVLALTWWIASILTPDLHPLVLWLPPRSREFAADAKARA